MFYTFDKVPRPLTSQQLIPGNVISTYSNIIIKSHEIYEFNTKNIFENNSDKFTYFELDNIFSKKLILLNSIHEEKKFIPILKIKNISNETIYININSLFVHFIFDSIFHIHIYRTKHFLMQTNKKQEVVEPIVEQVVDHVVEPIVEQVVDPVVELVVDPVVELVVDHVVEQVVDPVVELVVDHVVEQVVEPVVEQVVEPKEEKREENSEEKSEEKSEENSEDKCEDKCEEKSEEKCEEKSEEKCEEKSEVKGEEKCEVKGEEKCEDKLEVKNDTPKKRKYIRKKIPIKN
jgi:hypothetical protein